MSKTVRSVVGLVVFVASYVVLTFYVAPLLTQKGGSVPLDEAAMARFPVLVVLRQGSEATSPSFSVTQMRHLESVTAKAANYSFLLPVGSNKIVDQDGDPATFTAQEISPGRQRIALQAMVGDYTHDVKYEAEEKKVFPLSLSHTDPKLGLWTIPISALLAWIVLRLTRNGRGKVHQPGTGNSGSGNDS
jgi:hypothetical protein